jgi:hypothetical protein
VSSTLSNAVVCLEGSRLAALQTETTRTGVVTVRAAVCKSVPGLAEEGTGKASGEIKKILNADGFAKSVCLALPRHEVIVKQLTIRCGDLEDADLMPMVRLALGRENAVDLPSVEIDYTVISREDKNATVLVAAIDRARLGRLRAILSGAGRKVTSVRVRSDGLAAYTENEEATLVVAPGPSGCEFAVVRGGVSVLSRASQDSITPDQIRVEADRTLFSSRMVNPAMTGQSPALVSSSASEFPETWTHAPSPPSHPTLGKSLQNVHLPLLGLAVEEPGPHRIDWQNPQKAVDRAAPARQRVMLAAFVLIAMVGTSWVLGNNKTTQLDGAISTASQARDKARDAYLAYLVDQARLKHETQWTRARVDWAAHLDSLIATLPPPGDVLLNEISGRSESRVTFRTGDRSTLPGTWGVEHAVRLDLSGTAKDRATIEALRATLLAREQSKLTINGADTDDEFNLQLTTPLASPREAGS